MSVRLQLRNSGESTAPLHYHYSQAHSGQSGQIDTFKIYSYLIEPYTRNTHKKQLHEKYK